MVHLCKTRSLQYVMLAVLSALLVLIAPACSAISSQDGDGSFLVATSPFFPPFEFKTEDDTLQGFDIDLMTAIAQTQNLEIEFREMSYDDVIRVLLAGEVDAAISGISITPERADVVSFSRPYFESGLAIAVAIENTDITSAAALEGKNIGAEARTTGEAYAQTVPNGKVKRFETIDEAFQQLVEGNLDAVINDYPVTQYSIRQGLITNIKPVGEPLTQEYYGIAVPQNSQALDQINAGLTTVIENGQYAEIYSKWFDSPAPPLPEVVPGLE